MKNLKNLINGQTRFDAIVCHGVEYGTEQWHKRCTGDTTASAMQLLAQAIKKQGKAFEVHQYADLHANHHEDIDILETCKQLITKLDLKGFTVDTELGLVTCNVFQQI